MARSRGNRLARRGGADAVPVGSLHRLRGPRGKRPSAGDRDGPGRCRTKADSPRGGQTDLFSFTFQPVLVAPPSVPSCFCSLYSHSILAKLRLTWSVGTIAEFEPPAWKLETRTSDIVTFRYSCWSLPALRQVRTAFLR